MKFNQFYYSLRENYITTYTNNNSQSCVVILSHLFISLFVCLFVYLFIYFFNTYFFPHCTI